MSEEHQGSSVREALREEEEKLNKDESSKLLAKANDRPNTRGLKRSRSLLQADEGANSLSPESELSSGNRSVSLFGGSKTENSTTSRTSRRFSAPSLASSSSSKSQLFPDEDPSLLAPATLLGPNGNSSQTQTPKTAGERHSSSLFGAVMKNVEASHTPSTPQQSIKQYAFSPGGFQIRDFLNSVNSPFHLPSSSSPASATPLTPRHMVDWHETQVDTHSIGILDWSLKRKLQLEGQPGISFHQSAHIQQRGMLHFVSGNKELEGTFDPKTASAIQWEAGLLHWQHPAVYPLPPQLRSSARVGTVPPLRDVNGADSRTAKSNTQYDTDKSAKKTAMPPPQRPLVQSLKTKNESSSFLERRRREWQEAFGSLYMKWIQAVRDLAEQWNGQSNLVDDVPSDIYFYAVGQGHVILFRVSIDCSGDCKLAPEIVISSSSRQTRDKLRAMGAKLMLLEGWEGMKGEFDEDAVRPAQSEASKVALDASPAVKAELAALRRAQVFGQNVGADVSVSMKAKSRMVFRSPKTIPPLLISGEDDCAAFFEVYLNTSGQISSATPETRGTGELLYDVPLLLCRKVGAFLHSSLTSNRLVKKRDPSVADSECNTSIELHGILLPCAVQQLVSAVISDMYTDGKPCDEKSDNESSSGEDVGSHHLVVRATTQDGVGESVSMPGTIGAPDTTRFNCSIVEGDTRNIQSCRYGEAMMMAVWDIGRPTALAYKLDYTSSTLLG